MATTVTSYKNFVGGEWVAATGENARTLVSPVTGETLAEAPDASSVRGRSVACATVIPLLAPSMLLTAPALWESATVRRTAF